MCIPNEYGIGPSGSEKILSRYKALLHEQLFPLQTASEYFDRELAHLRNSSLKLERLPASPYCHDATWTLAKALQLTIQGGWSIPHNSIMCRYCVK